MQWPTVIPPNAIAHGVRVLGGHRRLLRLLSGAQGGAAWTRLRRCASSSALQCSTCVEVCVHRLHHKESEHEAETRIDGGPRRRAGRQPATRRRPDFSGTWTPDTDERRPPRRPPAAAVVAAAAAWRGPMTVKQTADTLIDRAPGPQRRDHRPIYKLDGSERRSRWAR